MSDFYASLPVMSDFASVVEADHYEPAPADWWIVISDVEGSTAAIEAGNYRAVNFVGAITIAAALNATKPVEMPFVFGGDGATLLVPPEQIEAVLDAMRGVQATAQEAFDLKLRVGAVPVGTVYAEGQTLLVGRYATSKDYTQAVFVGGGLAYAERLVKDPDAGVAYRISGVATQPVDFSGIECRWKNIESAHGETIALLVAATTDDLAQSGRVYQRVLNQIEAIYGSEEEYHPVRASYLKPSFSLRRLASLEPMVREPDGARWPYVLRIWLQQILLVLFVRFGIKTGETTWQDYLPKIQETTDVRKFDEMLRMVIAGTPDQRRALVANLDEAHAAGDLVYGLHVADSAVMTCLVYERLGQQVHFVDGADGGYALAAKMLKKQLRELT